MVHVWEVDSLLIRRLLPPSSPVCRSTAWLFRDLQRLGEKAILLEDPQQKTRDADDCGGHRMPRNCPHSVSQTLCAAWPWTQSGSLIFLLSRGQQISIAG